MTRGRRTIIWLATATLALGGCQTRPREEQPPQPGQGGQLGGPAGTTGAPGVRQPVAGRTGEPTAGTAAEGQDALRRFEGNVSRLQGEQVTKQQAVALLSSLADALAAVPNTPADVALAADGIRAQARILDQSGTVETSDWAENALKLAVGALEGISRARPEPALKQHVAHTRHLVDTIMPTVAYARQAKTIQQAFAMVAASLAVVQRSAGAAPGQPQGLSPSTGRGQQPMMKRPGETTGGGQPGGRAEPTAPAGSPGTPPVTR